MRVLLLTYKEAVPGSYFKSEINKLFKKIPFQNLYVHIVLFTVSVITISFTPDLRSSLSKACDRFVQLSVLTWCSLASLAGMWKGHWMVWRVSEFEKLGDDDRRCHSGV